MAVIFIFILSSTLIANVKGYSCDQGQCYCFDNRITCIDMTGPKFRYRMNINILYIEHVQILDFESIIKNLPNLEYLTMMNMRFFRCEWLNDIPKGINLQTNMCVTHPKSETTSTPSYWTNTGRFFTDIFSKSTLFSLYNFSH